MQVTTNPMQIVITVINANETCKMLKNSGTFALSILDKDCTFETIKHFGYQSGRDVNKFESFPYKTDLNGNPYLTKGICSVISAKVVSSLDLGTHTLFVAEVQDAQITSDKKPITYSDYQNEIKPKQKVESDKKIIGWRCKICGYEYMHEELPKDYICPICGHPAEDFEPIYEN
jgi:flavin reductase (DIM6/NTAB) family NADH-FMN oxidoreductase RutF/rubredoxin